MVPLSAVHFYLNVHKGQKYCIKCNYVLCELRCVEKPRRDVSVRPSGTACVCVEPPHMVHQLKVRRQGVYSLGFFLRGVRVPLTHAVTSSSIEMLLSCLHLHHTHPPFSSPPPPHSELLCSLQLPKG